MDIELLTRLQFAVTTLYHYLFVPVSISLSLFAALLQTTSVVLARRGAAQRSEVFDRLALLTGKLLMVTFAVGVVTGLVQEFQFGLSWSQFARFYGDVFGPTLAVEGMLAFFLEATFLGLWWFGRDRLPRALHLATIWVVAVGTTISAFVILAANSFMQNPVAYTIDEATGRARLGSFRDLLLNEVNLAAFPHTLAGAVMAGGALVMAVGVWHLLRGGHEPGSEQFGAFRTLSRFGAWATLVGGAATAITGDLLGKVITVVQPMKMAAAEALYETTTSAPFSIFAYAPPGSDRPTFSIEVPGVLSFLGKGSFTAEISGLKDLQEAYVAQFGPGDYTPWVPAAFWSFRLMIGVGMLAAAVALVHLWVTRKSRPIAVDTRLASTVLWSVPVLPLLPLAANSFGWIFTETGRQPWLVFGLYRTADGVSPGLTAGEVALSLAAFTLVYGALAWAWTVLVTRLVRKGLPDVPAAHRQDADETDDADDTDVALTY
ncbi:cytochrome ubiquinol oxidase subunit I [Paenibacillus sp. TRM 82003]|uniref:cytochrome ubiquinol oxidase subunit I n=1 Tax=Kineococcus sp. TRM81007 TaxID=2925831 RepID=UPI001F5AB6A3|nr:cytochrome ubiquinol oxidase subunit I [Kineococcus sp. TRM81007]MCI2240620.1 cytochrome ubiquinol oxidase subunit I [Kineococcus sp. TRM81007]MCI3925458.1 cytochrome ubiquinol oxidase subunit I [Paenibacillus sp. TRM 82003]